MSEEPTTPTTGDGQTVVTIGFRFEDTLTKIISDAKEAVSDQLKAEADSSIKNLSDSARVVIELSNRLGQIDDLVKEANSTAQKAQKTAEDAMIATDGVQQALQSVMATEEWKKRVVRTTGSAPDVGGVPSSPPPTTEASMPEWATAISAGGDKYLDKDVGHLAKKLPFGARG